MDRDGKTPPPGSLEAWALGYVSSTDLEHKRRPGRPTAAPAPPGSGPWEPPDFPGRPPELTVVARAPRAPRPGALVHTEQRARLLHTFWHHELQAAELFARALLAFPDTPVAFRAGLVDVLFDELAHMALYERELTRLGCAPGAFPVRDWFWERVPTATEPRAFLALVGLGLEAANLDHGETWARRLEAAGDPAAAAVQRRVAREEEAHVAFAARWWAELGDGPLDFAGWRAALPAPLTPLLFRGKPLARDARARSGQDARFLDALEAWEPDDPTPQR